MTTKQLHCLLIIICALGSFVATCGAAPTPYFEDFESYAVGDTPVANFTEVDSTAWTIVAPSFSGQAYENEISVFSPGPGIAAGENSSAVVDFPGLAASGFSISTSFVIDELTLDGSDPTTPPRSAWLRAPRIRCRPPRAETAMKSPTFSMTMAWVTQLADFISRSTICFSATA
jgi:hypothetical protein